MPTLRFPLLRPRLFLIAWALHAAVGPAARADDGPGAALDADGEVARLGVLPASHIPLKGATLGSAIRLLAGAAQMSYLIPPDDEFSERITSDVRINPYRLLQILAKTYNFAFDYQDGVWQFYRINLNELVSKSYTLRFNNLQQVSIHSSSINSQLAQMGSMTSGSTPAPAAGGSGDKGTFDAKTGQIIEDIKKILVLPTVGLSTPSLDGSPATPGPSADQKPMEAPRVEPIWNPDTSQLFVVATRQQHSLISAYLKTIDRPQKLIRIAVKFVETARNPQQALGVDWSQTFLGSGGPIALSGAALTTTASTTSNAGSSLITVTNGNGSSTTISSGTGGSSSSSGSSSPSSGLNPLGTAINLNHPGSVQLPFALLSAPAFQWTAQAIATDKFSSVVQDPVIYTSNNREVSFKATTQQPIQEGTTTIGSGTAATSAQIAYIDVGTEVTILPCILPGAGAKRELIQLNLSINVSTITGQQVISGNSYPITSSRTYSYSVSIPNGETLAIAGLEERSRQTNDSKVPIFGDIPLIGYAFKNKNDSVVHTTLLAFITPELIRTDAGEAAGTEAALPEFNRRVFQGSHDETLAQVDESLEGMDAEIDALQSCVTRANQAAVSNRLDLIGVELALIDVRLGELSLAQHRVTAPEAARVARAQDRLERARDGIAKVPADEK